MILSNFGLRLLKAIIGFVVTIIISRYLNAVGRGEIAIILLVVQFAQILHDFVGGSTIANMLVDKGANAVIPWIIVWSVLVITILSVFNWLHSITLPWEMVLYALLLLWLTAHYNYYQALNKLQLRNSLQLAIEIARLIFIVILILLNKLSVQSILGSLCIATACVYLISRILLRDLYKKAWQKPFIKNTALIRFGFVNQLAVLSQFLVYRQGLYVLEKYFGKAEAGIWSNVLLVIEVVWLFANTFGMVLHAQILQNNTTLTNSKTANRYIKISFLGTFLVCIVLLVLPSSFYALIFGNEFGAMASLIKITIPGVVLFSMGTILANFMHGYNKFKVLFICNAITALVQFLIIISLIGVFKNFAVAIAFSVSLCLQFLLQYLYFTKYLKLNVSFNFKSFIKLAKLKLTK